MKQKIAALLIATALAAVPAWAQTNPSSTSGVVVSSTTDSLVVRLDDGTQRTFAVDSTSTLPSARLSAGARVTVKYHALDAGRFHAARVELVPSTTDRPAVSSTPTDSPMTSERATDRPATTDREALPATASPMPLLALVGLAAMFTAAALSAVRRQS